jgi:hypothetical protein
LQEGGQTQSPPHNSSSKSCNQRDEKAASPHPDHYGQLKFQAEVKTIAKGSFEFRTIRNGIRVITREMADYSAIMRYLDTRKPPHFTFYFESLKPVKAVIRHLPGAPPLRIYRVRFSRFRSFFHIHHFTWAVLKVREFILLLRVGTLCRCGDGLFSQAPPLASDAVLTTLQPLLENVLKTVYRKLQEDSGTGGFDLLITSRFIFHVCFSVSKALPPLENRSSSYCIVSTGLIDEL